MLAPRCKCVRGFASMRYQRLYGRFGIRDMEGFNNCAQGEADGVFKGLKVS